MIKNYVLVTMRNLLKNKVYTFINVFGLALGLMAFLFIIQYVRFETSYEDFHVNSKNIYRIYINLHKDAEFVGTDCETHAPFGPTVKEKMPEVLNYLRLMKMDGQTQIVVGTTKFFDENIYLADSSLASVFTVHFLEGNPHTALTDPNLVVLTKSRAYKYFGTTRQVLGKSMIIDGDHYTVSGIVEDLPPNSHLKMAMFLSHSSLLGPKSNYDESVWVGNNEYTYLLMKPGTDLAGFNRKISELSASLKVILNNSVYQAEPMRDVHLYSNKGYEPEPNGSAKLVWIMITISGFILVIAWVNYINLSTARAMNRAREVGVRKVMGSLRSQLVTQFFAESFVLNLLAGILCLSILWVAFPFLRDLTGQPLPLNYMIDKTFWYMLTAAILMGTVLSGVYPAMVLSSFQPVAVLKGRLQSSRHGQLLRKGLVVFQFSATLIMIVCMGVVYMQINYMRHFNLGISINQTLVVQGPRDIPDSTYDGMYAGFRTELLSNPRVKGVTRSQAVAGMTMTELPSTYFSRVGEDEKRGRYYYHNFGIDADFIPHMKLTMLAGRNFDEKTSQEHHIILNEEAVRSFGFQSNEEAIGGKITTTRFKLERPFEVVGVIKNYAFRSPKEPPFPLFMRYSTWARFYSIRADANGGDIVALVRESWDKIYPGSIFDYYFLDESYNRQYIDDIRFGNVTAAFCLLATIIACLGLFGLASFTIVQRTREIGIRKIMGASVTQIVQLLSTDFIKVVLIAAGLAVPIAYLAMQKWLSSYAVKVGFNVWLFAIPVLLILVIALLTVSFQTIKTALMNPSEVLSES